MSELKLRPPKDNCTDQPDDFLWVSFSEPLGEDRIGCRWAGSQIVRCASVAGPLRTGKSACATGARTFLKDIMANYTTTLPDGMNLDGGLGNVRPVGGGAAFFPGGLH